MTAWTDSLAKFSRSFLFYVEIELDSCDEVWSDAPCVPTGSSPCWYTWSTCQDAEPGENRKKNYNKTGKTYKFSTKKAEQILKGELVLPLIGDVQDISTELNPKNSTTIATRMNITFEDMPTPPIPNHDKGTGKYNTTREGTFWKTLVARNPNYRGRKVTVYSGEPQYTSSDFQKIFDGVIDNGRFNDKGNFILTLTDNLTSLQKITIPPAISSSNVLTTTISDAATTIPVTDGTEFKLLSGTYKPFCKIEDEYIQFSDISSNDLLGAVRGRFGTTAAIHVSDLPIIQVAPFASASDTATVQVGIDMEDLVLETMQGWLGLSDGQMNLTDIQTEVAIWLPGLRYRQILEEPVNGWTFAFEKCRTVLGHLWQGEDQRITFKTLHPVGPHEAGTTVTGTADVDTVKVDEKLDDFVSRVIVYYNPADSWGKKKTSDDPEAYNSILILIDADAENANNFNAQNPLIVYAPHIFRETEARIFANRYERRFGSAGPPKIVSFTIDQGKAAIATGDVVAMTIQEILDVDGAQVETDMQILSKRMPITSPMSMTCMEVKFKDRYCFIGHTGANDYDSATDLEKRHCYICDSELTCGTARDPAYYIY